MSERQAWPSQPYLDELRPKRDETVRLALFTSYSVDLSAVAATLLALIGRNDDKGSGTAVDFAIAIDELRGKMKIIVQRGHIARPKALPRIAGILDQFVVEKRYDERTRSWHPKIALIAYNCPAGRVRWKLWIGSRNLTRAQDLDVGVLLEGFIKRAKGRVRLPGVGAMGASLARDVNKFDPEVSATELEDLWWEAPAGFTLRSLLNGLEEDVAIMVEPPKGSIKCVTIISPFLSADFLKIAGGWGADGTRTLISSMPALIDMAKKASKPLSGFSRIFCYAAPDVLFEGNVEESPDSDFVNGEDEEPAPLALHAKVYSFDMSDQSIVRMGSANATSRAWSGRNSEVMLELAAGEEFRQGIEFLVGKAVPIDIEKLSMAEPSDTSNADALEMSRMELLQLWDPILLRDGNRFSIDAQKYFQLSNLSHQLKVGLANGVLHDWPPQSTLLDLGDVALPDQSAFIQVCINGLDRDLKWIQRVDVCPELEPERDLAALASHMGIRAFHEWMRAMLHGDLLPMDGALWDEGQPKTLSNQGNPGFSQLTLEDILSGWARNKQAFKRVDEQFDRYVTALLQHGKNLSVAQQCDLQQLAQVWKIARESLIR